jgi:hypothetical protein
MIKSITIQELKDQFSDRHGFVFIGESPSDPKKCELAAQLIREYKYSETLPEFIGQLDARTFAFVYPEGSSMDMPALLNVSRHVGLITKAFELDALSAWLKNL